MDDSWHVKSGPLITEWGENLDPHSIWMEYPRPQLQRSEWLNLNGFWDFELLPKEKEIPIDFSQTILVPFCPESILSGIATPVKPNQKMWYRKNFSIPEPWHSKEILLHFGAVDWKSKVYVNKVLIGEHQGGYTPFSFNITPAIHDKEENEIIVEVWDPSEKGHQPSGKQWLRPGVVFYTPTSGIWQTVWIEPVSHTHIDRINVISNIDENQLQLELKTVGGEDCEVFVEIQDENTITAEYTGNLKSKILLSVPNAKLWTPESPHLYSIIISLSKNNQEIDKIRSYCAMRKFSIAPDSQGIVRFHLNNKPYFMSGVLDQGYWPDGLYTAPSEAALFSDIQMMKEMGFNTIRKHIKIEPAIWYHYCDSHGMLVWQDMPNGGGKTVIGIQMLLHLLHITPRDDKHYRLWGYGDPALRKNFESELHEMITHLQIFPSIAIWVPFNEAWGQFDSVRMTNLIKSWDPTRLVDHASGWFDQKTGDFKSIHNYSQKLTLPKKEFNRAVIFSEFGGYTLKLEEHAWNPNKTFGYKKFQNVDELGNSFDHLYLQLIKPLISQGLSGIIYTQTSDVEIEYNGLISYDRKKLKFDKTHVKQINEALYRELE